MLFKRALDNTLTESQSKEKERFYRYVNVNSVLKKKKKLNKIKEIFLLKFRFSFVCLNH